eukprot:1090216-Amphidinium_carterae.1
MMVPMLTWMTIFLKGTRTLSTGPIPDEMLKAPAVLLGHNLLQGSIPEHLLDGQDSVQKWVGVSISVSTF